MNYKKAFNILEIDLSQISYNDISTDYLKRQYKKLALKNHPDKNGNTLESNEKFKEINEAYHYLRKEFKNLNQDENVINDETNNESEYFTSSSLYFDILKDFMKTIFEGKYNEIILEIVNKIIIAGKKISIKLFDNLDKDTTLNIYTFLSNNRSVLHLSEEVLDVIRNIVVQKYDNVEIYRLNPSINDLLNNNVYKLVINNELFLVPLWHNELYFDISGCEIIVICEPELPENIKIDDDNNIYIRVDLLNYHNKILNEEPFVFNIGENIFNIPLEDLYMKKEQTYKIKNAGLSKIKNDIYDISEKSDIIVSISIV